MTVILVEDVALHPDAFVTVTVYVPALDGFVVGVDTLFYHWYETPPDAVNDPF